MQSRMDEAFRLARDPVNSVDLRAWIESERRTRFGDAYCAAFQSLRQTVDEVERAAMARIQQELVI